MIAITRVAGKPHITPRLDAMWHRGIAGTESGVFEFFESFKAEISSINKIRIRSGIGMLQGRFFAVEPSTYDEVSIGNGTQGEKRIDLIVARWTVDDENNVQDGDWHVIQGTPTTGTPAVPAHTTGDLDAGDLIADMPMFQVELNGVNITAIKKVYKTCALPITQGGTGKTTAAEALEALGGISWTKIWENASPGSAFVAQTLNSSVLGGTLVSKTPIRIEWRASTTGGERFFLDSIVDADMLCNFIANGNANAVPVIRTRNVRLRSTGIEFDDAYSKTITNNTTYVNNVNSVIPVAIYAANGWKGV